MSNEIQTPQNDQGEQFIVPSADVVASIEPISTLPYLDHVLVKQQDPTLRQRAGELVGNTIDFAKVAYHGLAIRVALIREQRASKVMEKMDHKNNLYGVMEAKTYRGGFHNIKTINGKEPKPQTRFEKRVEEYIKEKDSKRKIATINAKGAQKTMGLHRNTRNSNYLRGMERRRRRFAGQTSRRLGIVNTASHTAWRNSRRQRAIDRIKTSHRSRENHLAAIDRIAPDIPGE